MFAQRIALTLVITQDGNSVAFTDDEGRVRRYSANGQNEKHQLTSGTIQTKTGFKAGTLVIETSLPQGVSFTTTYAVETATDRLIVTRKPSGRYARDRPPLQSVYERGLETP